MARIAVLGTGLLGAGFAENLLEKGEEVVVWNRTARKTEPLVARGATAASSPAEAAAGAARVHLVLTSDDAVDAVIMLLLPGLGEGAWLVDHSTNAPARVAERYGRLRAQGIRYVPAPVFMAPQHARTATGLMVLAATDTDAAALVPALETMTGKVWHVGARADLAAVYKLCGNGLLVGLAGLMGDLFAMGQAQGLSPDEVLALFEVFRAGGMVTGIGGRVAAAGAGPASFELTMARKDVRLMVEAAGGPHDLVVLPAVAGAMDAGIAAGKGSEDFAVMAWPGRPARD